MTGPGGHRDAEARVPAGPGLPRRGFAFLIRALLGDGEVDAVQARLARGAGGTVALKFGFYGLAFVTSILLARVLGPAGFGAYAYAMAWVVLLSIPATLGLDRLLVRDTATYAAESAWGSLRGLKRRANQIAAALSLGLAGLAGAVSWWFRGSLEPEMLSAFWIALALVPLLTLMRLRQATLQGLHQVVVGQMPELLAMPALFLALIAAGYLASPGGITASTAMWMNVVSAAFAFLLGTALLHRGLPQEVRVAPHVYHTSTWFAAAWPMFLVAGMNVINERVATILLGAIRDAESVGVFSVVLRGSELIAFFFLAVAPALAPTVANLRAGGDTAGLQNVAVRTARATLALALPVGVVLIFFGDKFLLLYGPAFTQGRLALAVLSIGQLANVALGPVSLILLMTGGERDAAWALGITAALSLALNAVLIPGMGLTGAALATAGAVLLRGLLLSYLVTRRLGIRCHAFAGRVEPRSAPGGVTIP